MRLRHSIALGLGTLIVVAIASPAARACWWWHRPYSGPAYYGPPVAVAPPVVVAQPGPGAPALLPPSAVPTVPIRPPAGARATQPGGDPLVERGKYLVLEVAGCTHCHTPHEKGKPVESKLLRGATLPIQPKDKKADWAPESPDITRSGLAGKWGEAGLVKFLTTGKDPDGGDPVPPMPAYHLNQDDARAIARYLLSIGGEKKGAK
jgi:hypothetical protein